MAWNPFKWFARPRQVVRRSPPLARLSIEELESRVVLSSTPVVNAGAASVAVASTATVPLGANIPGVNDGSLQNVFVDMMKQSRGFTVVGSTSTPATLDANGWPTENFQVILQTGDTNLADIYNGTYSLSFTGQANVALTLCTGTVTNQVYNAATNTTTANVNLDETDSNSGWYFALSFTGTNGGVQNIKLIRPGYAPNTTQVFTNQFLATLQPFSTLRLMDFTDTNNNPVVNWSDRTQMTAPSQAVQWDAATQQYISTGVAWEYVATLADVTGKDIWINIPEGATDAYVVQLATLVKEDLDPGIHVYVEYSNELWNYGAFSQGTANLNAALAEVQAGVTSGDPSPLAYPGETASANEYDWATRRVAERLVQISNDFASVWGGAAIDNQIRPVLASQIANPYLVQEDLEFIQKTYGPPSQFIYGIAGAPYFYLDGQSNLSTPQDVLTALQASLQQEITLLPMYAHWATYYGLQDMAYEGGPDISVADNSSSYTSANLDAELAAASAALLSPSMEGLVEQYLNAWYANGGGLFNWFYAGPSNYSDPFFAQYGDWGMTDNITNLSTPEYLGAEAVLAAPAPALTGGPAIPSTVSAINYTFSENIGSEAGNSYPRYLNNGAILDYIVQAPQAGTYNLTINYAAVNPGEQLEVLVNDQPVQTLILPVTGPGYDALYSPDDFANAQPVPLTLSAGLNVVRLEVVASGFTINQLQFTAGSPSTSQGPTVATAASASPSAVTGTSTSLSALGADVGGAASLTYTWSTTGTPPAPVTFSVNGTNAAQNTTATFSKAGVYSFVVTIEDASGLTTTSTVTVNVVQTLTGLTVAPGTALVLDGATQQFSATGTDQFGNAMTPSVTWSVSGSGTGSINSAGLYTAPLTDPPGVSVTASSGSVSSTATVTLTAPPPKVATPASASPTTVTGISTNLSVLGADVGGAASLTYTWSTTGTPPAPVSFSANGTNAAQNTTATFSKAGAYSFLVTIEDASGLTTTSAVTVTVVQTLTKLTVAPGTASVLDGATQQLSATGTDQFGNAMTPSVTWSVSGAGIGSISNTGLYAAPTTGTPSVTIAATSGSISGIASITVTAPAANLPSYAGGFTSTGMTLNGNAALSGSRLRLTNGGAYEASSAFCSTPLNVTQFWTQFTFQLTNATADGFAFVIQGNSPTALGALGGDLGYGGIGKSVAIKFDLYNNAGEGNDSTGMFTNGANPYTPDVDLSSTGINLHSGDVFDAAMSYSGSTLTVTITDTTTNASATQSYAVNISSLVGGSTAYVGFTGGTGGLTAVQDILAWTYTSGAAPTPPTVATAASASPSAVAGTSTRLSVLGADAGGAANLTYTWSTTGTPPAPVTFSVNGINAAQNTTATFSKAGTYSFLVTIEDTSGLTTTSAVTVTVVQTLTGLTVAPGTASVLDGATQQFSVAGTDQFGNAMTPSVTWTVSGTGAGSISSTGLYTAPATGASSVTITATSGNVSGTASVTVNAPAVNVPSYSSGFTSTGMTLNGNATLSGSRLRLTNGGTYEASSAFYRTPLNITQFSTQFAFQLTNASADGFAFVIQGNSPTALGKLGGDLGYGGIGKSVAIKFDLYNNAGEGNDSTGLFSNGADPYTPDINLSSTGINLHSGDVFNAAMSYNGSTLTVAITDTTTNASATQSYAVNISSLVGGSTAYVGFTGGTGGLTAVQDILTWTYASGAATQTPMVATAASTSPSTATVSNALLATSVVIEQGPTVAKAASASLSTVTGKTTTLSVLGADAGGAVSLTYTWSATGTPPASVKFSGNGTNAAKNTAVTFSKAGTYSFVVTIRDKSGLTTTSTVTVTVVQTLTKLTVAPGPASVLDGATQQFSVSGADQFGNAMTPAVTWSVSGGGSISSTGLYTAPASGSRTVTIIATSGKTRATASVLIKAPAAPGAIA